MSNTPKIRFAGFTENWEERKLGEMMNVTSVKRIHQSDWTSSGVRFLRARDIVAAYKHEEPSDYLYITEEKYHEYSALSGKVKIGDLLVTGVGTIGVPMLINNDDPLYFKDGNIIWFQNENKINGNFLYYSFAGETIQNFIKEAAGTGTVGTYTINSGKKTPIMLPDDESERHEQQLIGTYFGNLDNFIALHQREYEKLVALKAACLDKMFPKSGSKVPEVRFSGFTEDWKTYKIKEITNRYDNLRIPVTAKLRVPGSTPYYGANGIQDYVEGFTHEGEFVLVAEDGANDLKNYPVQYVSGKIWVNNHAHVLQGKAGIADNRFLSYLINRADIESFLVGGGRAKLNAETLMDIKTIMPEIKEQQAIALYLSRLDNLIALHQSRAAKLKQLKQSMLHNMFV